MIQESLARKFKPAGFEQPEGSRESYRKPSPELQEAFYKWIDELPEVLPNWKDSENQYQKAVRVIEDFSEIPYKEANSLLIDFKPKTKAQKEAGLFLSACYTRSSEDTIIFDADVPEIDCIGYKTKKNIFNNGQVGNYFASWSSGLSVNNGDCIDWFASWSSGLAVNNGDCGYRFARYSSGLTVAVKEPKGYGYREKGKTIRPADCARIHDLKKYLEELSEITKSIKDEESAKRFLERYGTKGWKIKRKVKTILRKGGPEV